jgi:hypothetical protein
MWKPKNIESAVFVIAVLASCWPVPRAVIAQTKASVPKQQNTLGLGEDAAKQLLLLMKPNKDGKISKEAWMKFMGEEFDKLDKDKTGELDAQELRRSIRSVKQTTSADLGK